MNTGVAFVQAQISAVFLLVLVLGAILAAVLFFGVFGEVAT